MGASQHNPPEPNSVALTDVRVFDGKEMREPGTLVMDGELIGEDDLNLLGQDFCHLHNFRAWASVKSRTVAYYIGQNWEDPKPKL